MVKRLAPWLRAMIVIVALLTTQAQLVAALDYAPDDSRVTPRTADDASSESTGSIAASPGHDSLLSVPDANGKECALGVVGIAISGPLPAGTPNPAAAPPYHGIPTGIIEELQVPIPSHQAGDTLTWVVLVTNTSAGCTTAPHDDGPETLTQVEAVIKVMDTSNVLITQIPLMGLTFPGDPGVLAPGELAWAVVNFVIPDDAPNPIRIRTRAAAEDSTNSNSVPTSFVPNDTADGDVDDITILGPGFDWTFEPTPDTAPPNALVDFVFTLTNSRPGNTIAGIDVLSSDDSVGSGNNMFDLICSDIDNWVDTGTGLPISQLASGASARCTVQDVPIPSSPAPQEFWLLGEIEVTDAGGLTLAKNVASGHVDVTLPAVSVTKRVVEIRRGTQVVPPPASVGDAIHYEIVVTNTGDVPLNNFWIIDSLTGPILVSPATELAPATSLPPFTTAYTVQAGGQDPLTNTVTVTARGVGAGGEVSASAVASVDIADSVLEVDLVAEDPATGDPIDVVIPPRQVRYRMTIRNGGTTAITGINYVSLSAPLETVGNEPPINPTSLVAGGTMTFTWLYDVTSADDDPLTSTVRIRGTAGGNRIVYAQDETTIDLTSEDITLMVVVLEPETEAVLRGGEVVYGITVVNENESSPICNVSVRQLLRDPDTGSETPVVVSVPLAWPDPAQPGRLEANDSVEGSGDDFATGTSTYLVTGANKDPLHMVFEVTSDADCAGNGELSDRTSRVLDISNAQVNADLEPLPPVAQAGDSVQFTFLAQNVGAITIEELEATYCILNNPAACDIALPLTTTSGTNSIGSFEDATGTFDYTITSNDAAPENQPFVAEVTLFGKDNQGKQVSIKAATIVQIATENLVFDLSGPPNAVLGDTEQFDYTITNNTGVTLTDVRVYNTLVEDAGSPTGFLEVGSFATLPIDGQLTGSFMHTIELGAGVNGDVFTMTAVVTALWESTPMLATDSVDTLLIPILGVLKTGTGGSVVAGQAVTYDITITNNSKSQTVTITDYEDAVLADYTIPVDNNSFGTSFDTPGQWPAPTDPPGPPVPGSLPPQTAVMGRFVIPAVEALPSPLINTFVVTGRRPDGTEVSGLDDHIVNIACPIQFNALITNIDDDPDDVLGETLQWELSMTNVSGANITGLGVTETLNWPGQDPQINWPQTAGTLGAGQTATFEVFTKLITNQYYSEGEDFMGDLLTATFSEVAGTSECFQEFRYSLYSPIFLAKFPDPFLAFTGEEVSYYIYVENVTEDDDDPYGHYFVTAYDSLLQPNPIPLDYDQNGNLRTSGDLGPGEWVETTLTRTVRDSDPEELINVLTAEYPDPADPEVTFYTWVEATVFTANPLQLVKTPSTTLAEAGTRITYDYTITNISPYEVQQVTLTDTLIGELIPEGDPESLFPFESIIIEQVPYDIPVTSPDPVVNTATVSGTVIIPDAEPRDIVNSVTVTVDLRNPDIEVEKWVRDFATQDPLPDLLPSSGPDGIPEGGVGQAVDYCFRVTNNNAAVDAPRPYVANLAIDDLLLGPPGTLQSQFEAAIAALPLPSGETGRGAAQLFAGESVEFCYDPNFDDPLQPRAPSITLQRTLGDPVVNKVTITGTSSTGIDTYNEAELTVDLVGTDILITKSPSQPLAFVGEKITYTIRIENRNATTNIVDLELTDAFRDGVAVPIPLDLIDWSNSGVPGTPEGHLAPAGFALYSYDYVIQITDPDPLTNVAAVIGYLDDAVEPTERTFVEDSTRSALAVTASQLLVRKTATPNVALPGDNVRYTISITNVGSIPVQGIAATDTQYGGALTPTDTDLNPFETAFIYYDLPMPSVDDLAADPSLDPFINTVTATGTIFVDDQPIEVSGGATESVDILQPNIRIVKSPVTFAATQGQEVLYNITITNVGGPDETISNLVVRDITENETIDLTTFQYGPGSARQGVNWQAGDVLGYQESLVGTFSVTVPEDFVGNEYTNIAEVEGEAAPTSTLVRDRGSATIDIREEGINVEKFASLTAAPVGTPVTYTVQVMNVGGIPIDRVTIADPGMPGSLITITDGFPDDPDIAGDDSGTLDPDESFEHSYQHILTTLDGDPYVNRASATAYTTTGSTVVNVGEATVDVMTAAVAVEKFACAGTDTDGNPATINDPCVAAVNITEPSPVVTYYLHITNPSVIPLQNLTITDTLVPASTFDPIVWPGAATDGLDPAGTPGDTDEVWFAYEYIAQFGDPDPLTNLVTVRGESATTPTVQVQATDTAQISLVTSELSLTKTAEDQTGQPVAQASVGNTVTYRLTVTHTNPAGTAITNVEIVDPFSPQGANPICNIPTLAPGATDNTCTFTYTIGAGSPAPLVNHTSASGLQGAIPVSDTASYSIEIVTPGLSVTKVPNTPVAGIGEVVTFTYRIANTGTGVLESLSVVDNDPAITFSSPWPPYLTPGQVEVRTATRTMTAADPDPYTNTVTMSGRVGTQTRRAEATATVYIANGALVVTNTPNVPFAEAGDPVTFTYAITNLSTQTLTGVSLVDGLCTDLYGATHLNDQLASTDLAPGTTATVYCQVTAALPGPIVSTLYAQATEPPDVVVYDTATAEVAVTSGGLLVVKTADRSAASPGDTISYTVEVTNVGTETLSTIDVSDPLVVLSPAPPTGLLPGQSFTMTGTYVVPTTDPPDAVLNTVTVTAQGVTSGSDYEDSDAATVAVVENPLADLALTKQVNAAEVQPGDSITYTFRVQNIGDSIVDNITLVDARVPDSPVSIPSLAPGNAYTVTRTVTVPADWTQPRFNNTAQVFIQVGPDQELQDTATASVAVDLLDFTKTPDPAQVLVGGEIVYTFDITSHSTGTITGVTLSDPMLAFDPPVLTSVGPTGATATGRVTLPTDPGDPLYDPVANPAMTFVNTAQLFVLDTTASQDVLVEEATATVTILRTGLEVEILDISQEVEDTGGGTELLEQARTGLPVQVTFQITNTGAEAVTNLDYAVAVGITPAVGGPPTCDHTGTPLPVQLAPSGQTGDSVIVVCEFTPPIGRDNYPNAGDLMPTIDVTATGNSGGDALEETVSDTVQLVDLSLQVTLEIVPDTVGLEDDVVFNITLTNEGASNLGCDASVGAAELCHFVAAGSHDSNAAAGAMFNDLLTDLADNLANTVLLSGDQATFQTAAHTVSDEDEAGLYTISVDGGYYDAALDAADLLDFYRVRATGSAELIVSLPEIEVTVGVLPNPPVYNQNVTYTITVRNIGTVRVENLTATYQISPLVAGNSPNADGIMLVSGNARPPLQAASGPIALSVTALDPDQTASGILVKIEDQEGPYVFIATVVGSGVDQSGQVTDSADLTLSPTGVDTLTPTPSGSVTPTVTPDPLATEPKVEKTASVEAAQPGSDVVWTVRILNGGTVAMSNVTMQDQVPSSLTVKTVTVDRGSWFIEGQLITVSDTTPLNPGQAINVTITTTISADATSPSTITNTACAIRLGGTQQCVNATVNVGADVGELPATGIKDPVGFRLEGLFGAFFGLLILMGTGQVSNRRMWFAVWFVVISVAMLVGAVALLLTQDDDGGPDATQVADAPSANTPQPPSATPPAPDQPAASPPAGDQDAAGPGATPIMAFPPTTTPYAPPTPAGVRTLMIPKLADQFKNPIRILELPIVGRQWDISALGYEIGWLQGTNWLESEWGNTVLAAHVQLSFNVKGPFWALADLEPGDEIIVSDGALERRYAVYRVFKVDPSTWSVTAPTDDPMLTLITCTEWSDTPGGGVFSQRLVVQAVPLDATTS